MTRKIKRKVRSVLMTIETTPEALKLIREYQAVTKCRSAIEAAVKLIVSGYKAWKAELKE